MKNTIKKIHVNQHNIKANLKDNSNKPVFTIKNRGKTIVAESIKILGPSELIYSPENPLSCGARVWISTRSTVEIINESTITTIL